MIVVFVSYLPSVKALVLSDYLSYGFLDGQIIWKSFLLKVIFVLQGTLHHFRVFD